MVFSVFYGAKILGYTSWWTLTNYQIQRILYISNVVCIGRHNEPLFDEPFYAWPQGPVCARLYQELRQYGSSVVGEDIFINIKVSDTLLQSKGATIINQVYSRCNKTSKNIACIKGGAWYTIYNNNTLIKHITYQDMKEEYIKFYSR